MLSQGFSTTHVERTSGCSERSRKHCSDNHNMVTLRGHRSQPPRPPKAKSLPQKEPPPPKAKDRPQKKPPPPAHSYTDSRARKAHVVAQPTRQTGPELKPEHYNNSDAQPLAFTDSCTAQAPTPRHKWNRPPTVSFTDHSLYPSLQHPISKTKGNTTVPLVGGSGTTATGDTQPSPGADISQSGH